MVFPLLVAVVGIVVVFLFANRGISEPTVETKVARYAKELRAIGAEVPVPMDSAPGLPPGGSLTARRSSWTEQPNSRLAGLKANIRTADSIARDLEHQLATKSSGCVFAKAAGDAIDKEILPAAAATKNALSALLSGTKDRLKSLNEENNALGWVGWRGSREEEIYELLLLAHDIAITTSNSDLAFSRLKAKATALNKVALTCQ
ncbi:MAG: hypothetical protein E6G74_23830 [Alphaproteobacteria bacterium]|nr:MAG: hypothetical protein E6G74_23830 [Alphaproteobacteria bacterium]